MTRARSKSGDFYDGIVGGNTKATVVAGSFSNETFADNLSETVINEEVRYFHRDHQGSVTVITSATGTVVERFSYDAWGKRRQLDGSDDTASTIRGASTNRGYTLHEHIDAVGLIHMNGRVYDPLVGRFMSADPNVFHPNNMQDFNRYSYVHNQPLSAVDPSGFALQELSDYNMAINGSTALTGFLSMSIDRTLGTITAVGYSYSTGVVSTFTTSSVTFTTTYAATNQHGGSGVNLGGSMVSGQTSSGNRNNGAIMTGFQLGAADPNQSYVDGGDIYGHPILGIGAHGSAVVYPTAAALPGMQTQIANMGFTVQKVDYINFSGGPEYNVPVFFGDLVGDIYRETDLLASKDYQNTWRGDIYIPANVSVDEFAQRMIEATTRYNSGNRVNYNMAPEITGNHNSGSYFRSIVEAAGGIIWPPELIDGMPFVGTSVLIEPTHFGR